MIQRYDIESCDGCHAIPVENDNGEWVRREDIEDLFTLLDYYILMYGLPGKHEPIGIIHVDKKKKDKN